MLMRHLLAVGHRRIGVITGPPRNHDARERLRGVRAELEEAGVTYDAVLEVPGDFTEAAGYAGAARLVADRPPTAILACNDAMAVGALSALRDADVRVPEDVAVVGFDDIPIARYVSPPLTTVRVAIARLGERAAERLFEAIEQPDAHAPTHVIMPAELVVRRTCGAALGRDAGQGSGGILSIAKETS
jgi:LacI family transcriptional regulator